MKTQLFMNAFLAYLRYSKGLSNRSTVKQPVILYKTMISKLSFPSSDKKVNAQNKHRFESNERQKLKIKTKKTIF